MAFLDPDAVLVAAGYTLPVAPETWSANQLAAVAFAEAAIVGYTRAKWVDVIANVVTDVIRIRLDGARYALPLPRDVTEIVSVAPVPSSTYSQKLTEGGLELWDDLAASQAGMVAAWDAGAYVVTVKRGFVPDDRANRAAALLVAYFLRLPDPERSVYQSFAEGDFSGSFRFSKLAVPEAEGLLAPFRAQAARVTG